MKVAVRDGESVLASHVAEPTLYRLFAVTPSIVADTPSQNTMPSVIFVPMRAHDTGPVLLESRSNEFDTVGSEVPIGLNVAGKLPTIAQQAGSPIGLVDGIQKARTSLFQMPSVCRDGYRPGRRVCRVTSHRVSEGVFVSHRNYKVVVVVAFIRACYGNLVTQLQSHDLCAHRSPRVPVDVSAAGCKV